MKRSCLKRFSTKVCPGMPRSLREKNGIFRQFLCKKSIFRDINFDQFFEDPCVARNDPIASCDPSLERSFHGLQKMRVRIFDYVTSFRDIWEKPRFLTPFFRLFFTSSQFATKLYILRQNRWRRQIRKTFRLSFGENRNSLPIVGFEIWRLKSWPFFRHLWRHCDVTAGAVTWN